MTRRRIALGAAAAAAALALAAAGGAAWRVRARARHLAVPVLADPSLPPAPAAPIAALPAWRVAEVARVGVRVTALLRARDGALWVGTFDGGVLHVDVDGATPEAAPGLSGRERLVNALAEHDGAIWAATQGGLVALDGDRRVASALDGEAVTSLARVGRRLYAGTARGVFRVTVDGGAEATGIAGPEGEPLRVTALAVAPAGPGGPGRLWIGTASGAYAVGLAALDAPLLTRTAAWFPLVFGDPGAETDVVTALAPLPDGGAVAGTDDGGVARIGPSGEVSALRLADPRANEVNPGAAAPVAGGVLVGTQGGGLVLARPRGSGLEAGRPGGLDRLPATAILAGDGELLVGTADGVVLRVEPAAPDDRT